MGYTHDDLLKYQQTWGIPPEQSAKAYGVTLPDAPIAPVTPIDLGGTEAPAHPGMLADPGLLAGNEKKPTADAVLDAIGVKPGPVQVSESLGGDALRGTPFETMVAPPKKDPAALPSDIMAIAGSAGYSPAAQKKSEDYNPLDPYRERVVDGMVMRRARPEAPKEAPKTSDELAKAQALEAQSQGAQWGGPQAGPGISNAAAGKRAKETLGINDATDEAVMRQEDDVMKAQGGVYGAQSDASRELAKAYARQAAVDELYADELAKRRKDEAIRQNIAEQDIKIAQAKQDADGSEGLIKIGQMVSYIFAGIGNVLNAKGGAQGSDILQKMIANDDAAADRRYQQKVAVISRMKGDEAAKQERLRMAEADKTADYIRRRSAAVDSIQGIIEQNKANTTDAQRKFAEEMTMKLQSDAMRAQERGVNQLTDKIKVAASAPRTLTPAQIKQFKEYRELSIPIGGNRVLFARGPGNKTKFMEGQAAHDEVVSAAKDYKAKLDAWNKARNPLEAAKDAAGMSRAGRDVRGAAKRLSMATGKPILGIINEKDKPTAEAMSQVVELPLTETGVQMGYDAVNNALGLADGLKDELIRQHTSGAGRDMVLQDGTMVSIPEEMTGNAGTATGPVLRK